MIYLRYLLITLGLSLFAWQLSSFLLIDEMAIKRGISAGVPTRFIQSDEETSQEIMTDLKALDSMPGHLWDEPEAKDFGRSRLFEPDEEKDDSPATALGVSEDDMDSKELSTLNNKL